MTERVDLTSYYRRIGFHDQAHCTLETLRQLHHLHTVAIPFENLDILLRRQTTLVVDAIQEKLLQQRRGGNCYEQNLLFQAVLHELGFTVRPIAARPIWGMKESGARTHIALCVSIDGVDYLSDVGFPSITLTAPIPLRASSIVKTPHGNRMLSYIHPGELQLRAEVNKKWLPVYQLSLAPQTLLDIEVCDWFVSTNPNSIFTQRLIVSRPDIDGYFRLNNNIFEEQDCAGNTKRRQIDDADELEALLRVVFRISLPANARPLIENVAKLL
jgi:N-hydroxyarylamine O-acetyltransferase